MDERTSIRPVPAAAAAILVVLAVGCGGATRTGGRPVDVSLRDFRIGSATTAMPSGAVTFVVHNRAPATHEFVLLRTNDQADRLPIAANGLSVDEDRVHHVAEISEVRAGTTATLTVHLPPGHYVLICNLEGHYLGGMHHAITVATPVPGDAA